MISCREFDASLGPYLRGELAYPERMDLLTHAAGCRRCADELERARDALDVTQAACAAAREPAPDDVPESLLRVIMASVHSGA